MKPRRALVLGGAEGVWRDAEAALPLFAPDLIIAVNDIGVAWTGRVDHWVSFHPEKLAKWYAERKVRGGNADCQLWSHRGGSRTALPGLKVMEHDRVNWHGLGGLFGVRLALQRLGATHVVCAGVPMTKTPHFFDAKPWKEGEMCRAGWIKNADYLRRYVRSMSGWTRELLGAPTAEWLESSTEGMADAHR